MQNELLEFSKVVIAANEDAIPAPLMLAQVVLTQVMLAQVMLAPVVPVPVMPACACDAGACDAGVCDAGACEMAMPACRTHPRSKLAFPNSTGSVPWVDPPQAGSL